MFALGGSIVWCFATRIRRWSSSARTSKSHRTRLVRTNEEGDGGKTVTTVTFDETAGKTLLVVYDLYPSKDARDVGSTGAMPETLDQLDELLASLGSSTETK